MKQRLIWSLGFLVVLMYFSMGHMMWNWPVPAWMEGNHIAIDVYKRQSQMKVKSVEVEVYQKS